MDLNTTALLRKLPSAITVMPIYDRDPEPEDELRETRRDGNWQLSRPDKTFGTRHPDLSISPFEEASSSRCSSKHSASSVSSLEPSYSMCSLCDKLVEAEEFLAHMTGHELNQQRMSAPEEMNFTDDFRRSNGLYSCHECPLVFTVADDYKEHVNSHAVDEVHRCHHCLKSFRSLTVLQKHERIHNGTAPFPCTLCSRTFNQPVHLKSHLRRHNGETPYKCSLCPKAYADSSSLAYHTRTHAGIGGQPFTCPHCSKPFTKKWSFKLHLAKHARDDDGDNNSTVNSGDSNQCGNEEEEDSNYSSEPVDSPRSAETSRVLCLQCEKTFVSNSSLRRHERLLHGGNQDFSCKTCFRTFSKLVQLQNHERSKHSKIEGSSFSSKEKKTLRFICARCSQKFIDIAGLNQHKLEAHST